MDNPKRPFDVFLILAPSGKVRGYRTSRQREAVLNRFSRIARVSWARMLSLGYLFPTVEVQP